MTTITLIVLFMLLVIIVVIKILRISIAIYRHSDVYEDDPELYNDYSVDEPQVNEYWQIHVNGLGMMKAKKTSPDYWSFELFDSIGDVKRYNAHESLVQPISKL